MQIFADTKNKVSKQFADNYTVASLRMLIIAWAIFIVVLSLIVSNPVILAGILAWSVLP